MTLKQRRRQRELIAQIDDLKRAPHFEIPEGYVFGENLVEDKKYDKSLESFKLILEALHKLDMAARDEN